MLDPVRVVAITDRKLMGETPDAFGAAIERAVKGCPPGSVLVQIREKDLGSRRLLEIVIEVMDRVGQNTPILINGRLDVAIASGAAGVHFPSRGLPLDRVRRRYPDLLLGLSMVPKTTVAIAEESTAKQVVRLVEGLEDNDDVQDVYANFDIPEAVLEAVAS